MSHSVQEHIALNESVALATSIRQLGRAAYTLVHTPSHDALHQDVATITSETPYALESPLATTVEQVEAVLSPLDHYDDTLNGPQLVQKAGLLMQFSDYDRTLAQTVHMPYGQVAKLGAAFRTKSPATLADQLDTALAQSDHDIEQALWKLVIGSRHHARWLDGSILADLPSMSQQDKIKRMVQWQNSITAIKPFNTESPQDPTGDAYYCWTHAYAKVVYGNSRLLGSLSRPLINTLFHNGTNLMHAVIHRFNKQSIPSDHTLAAQYGNAIGEVCLRHTRNTS